MPTSLVLLRLRSTVLAVLLLFDGAHGALNAQLLEPMNNTEALLNDIQKRTFAWFWEFSNDRNVLTLDRAPKEDAFASIAAVGFALTAFPVAVERGFLKRNDAVSKTLATLEFFKNSTQI